MEMNSTFVFSLVIVVIVFLALREFNAWYWKLNEIVSLLNSIDDKLSTGKKGKHRKLENIANDSTDTQANDYEYEYVPFCYHCGAEIKQGVRKCPECNKSL